MQLEGPRMKSHTARKVVKIKTKELERTREHNKKRYIHIKVSY